MNTIDACYIYPDHIFWGGGSISISPSKLTYSKTKVDILQGDVYFGSMPKSDNIYSVGHIFKASDKHHT